MGKSLKVMAGLLTNRWKESSVCEACGNSFTCGATLAGCWCSDMKLTAKDREQLRARYKSCLCRTCLEDFGNGAKTEVTHQIAECDDTRN